MYSSAAVRRLRLSDHAGGALRPLHSARVPAVAQRALRVHRRRDVLLSPAAHRRRRRLVVPGAAPRRRRIVSGGAGDREHERAHGHVVVDGEQRLERVHDVAHAGPRLGHGLQALVRHLRRRVRGAHRVLRVQARVHDAVQLVGSPKVGPRPVHQVLLAAAPPLVDGPPPGEQLQQHHAEAVHVAPRREVARQDVLRRRVPVRAHHPRRHVRRVALGPLLRQPEVRQLRRIILKKKTQTRSANYDRQRF
uniref:Uncharacterized protein n=1 Tax=Oryza brachyantha TaxID=4533 RepID=J3MC56_ORYBR